MKKKLLLSIITIMLFIISGCSSSDDNYSFNYSPSKSEEPCGKHNGKQLYTGPRGGCFYINGNGKKTYVDRSECNC